MDKELAANAAGKQRGRPFKKGESGNPKGKIKGTKNYLTRLDEALSEIETLKGKNLFFRFIERAFASDKVLVAAMKKFVPDREKTEIESTEPIKLIIEHVGNKNKSNKDL